MQTLGGGGYCLEMVFEVWSDELIIVDQTAVSEGVKWLDPVECPKVWPSVGMGMEPGGMDLACFVSKEPSYLCFLERVVESRVSIAEGKTSMGITTYFGFEMLTSVHFCCFCISTGCAAGLDFTPQVGNIGMISSITPPASSSTAFSFPFPFTFVFPIAIFPLFVLELTLPFLSLLIIRSLIVSNAAFPTPFSQVPLFLPAGLISTFFSSDGSLAFHSLQCDVESPAVLPAWSFTFKSAALLPNNFFNFTIGLQGVSSRLSKSGKDLSCWRAWGLTSWESELGSVSIAIDDILDCLVLFLGTGVLGLRDVDGVVGGVAESDSVVKLASSPLVMAFDEDVWVLKAETLGQMSLVGFIAWCGGYSDSVVVPSSYWMSLCFEDAALMMGATLALPLGLAASA